MSFKIFQKQKTKEDVRNLEKEYQKISSLIMEKRKELKFLESPIPEKLNILSAKEQELRDQEYELDQREIHIRKQEELMFDLADTLGEKSTRLNILNLKEKIIQEKEDNLLKKL